MTAVRSTLADLLRNGGTLAQIIEATAILEQERETARIVFGISSSITIDLRKVH